jgi:hypothetical protein
MASHRGIVKNDARKVMQGQREVATDPKLHSSSRFRSPHFWIDTLNTVMFLTWCRKNRTAISAQVTRTSIEVIGDIYFTTRRNMVTLWLSPANVQGSSQSKVGSSG